MTFVAIVFPPRRPSSEVMSTRDLQSFMRSRSDSAEKPAKTTECTAPMRAHARKAATACHVIGRYTDTVSPFLTPSALSTFATEQTSRRSCAYVISQPSFGSSAS